MCCALTKTRGRARERFPASYYLVVGANLFLFSSFQWTYVTLPGYIESIGGGAAAMGLAFGLMTLSAVAARPLVGRLVDHWGRKPLLCGGAAIFTVSSGLYAVTGTLVTFWAVRLLHGVGLAAYTTAYTALVADLAPAARRGEAIGLAGVTNNLGMLVAPALGAYVQATWGYGTHFVSGAGVGLVSVLLLLPVVEPRIKGATDQQGPGLQTVLETRALWVAALGTSGLAVAYGAVLSFVAPLAAERELTAAGAYFTVYAVAMMAAQAVSGWLSDRLGRRRVAVPGLVMASLSIWGLSAARSNRAMLAAGAGLGLSWGLVRAALDTAVIDAVPSQARGMALAVFYTCFDISVGLGSFGLGLVAQSAGYAAPFQWAAAWTTVALVGYLILGRRRYGPSMEPVRQFDKTGEGPRLLDD